VELKAVELNHKAEIIERKERRELAALLARYNANKKSAKTIEKRRHLKTPSQFHSAYYGVKILESSR
jgi:hypothetical protein